MTPGGGEIMMGLLGTCGNLCPPYAGWNVACSANVGEVEIRPVHRLVRVAICHRLVVLWQTLACNQCRGCKCRGCKCNPCQEWQCNSQ